MKCVFVHWNIWEVNNNSFCLDWETSSLETLQFFLDIFLQSDNLRYPWFLSTFTVKSELLQLKLELFKTHRNQWQGICDHLIKSIQIRKSISKKTVKKRANEKPHRKRPSSHFRRCNAAAQSHTDLRWRTQTLAIRTGYFDQRRIVSTDRPSDNPDNFVHRSRPHNLGVYHTYQTWTREHNHWLQCCYLKQLCEVCVDLLHSSTQVPSPQSCWKSGHCRMLENDLNTYDTTYWSAEKAREEIQLYL